MRCLAMLQSSGNATINCFHVSGPHAPAGRGPAIAGIRLPRHRDPQARLILTAGLALQFTGATLLALDLCRPLASALLVAFTVSASAIFHRWWLIGDPLLSHLHLSNLLINCGVVGGLLLVAAI